MAYAAAVDVLTVVRDLIEDGWVDDDAFPIDSDPYPGERKPNGIFIWNEVVPARWSTRTQGDLVTVRYDGGEDERLRSQAWAFKDATAKVNIKVETSKSRQRALDIVKQIRTIIWTNVHTVASIGAYQVFIYKTFSEAGDSRRLAWAFDIKAEFQSAGIPVDSL